VNISVEGGKMDTHKDARLSEINISFCLPVYNVEKYLKDCVNSIVSQMSEGFRYEIVCVDDLSTDNSFVVLQELEKENPQLRAFKNEKNSGVGYTRNRLLSLAQGKYIWFVDPDDMLYPNVVELLFHKMESGDYNVLLGDYVTCDEEDNYNKFSATKDSCEFQEISIENEEYGPVSQTGEKMFSVCMGMFKREFLIENHLFFQEKMIAQEDTLFYYELSLKLDSIIKYRHPCYIYRQRSTSVMRARNPQRSKQYYLAMQIMYDVYTNHLTMEDYKNKEVLLSRIHHTRQNLATTLASIPETKYVKKEIKKLKQKGIYPYPFRIDALKTSESILRRVLYFLQPVIPFFWLLHLIYKISFIKYYRHHK
jgi:glycosyltransferase involved in cell wall biosynthesis